MYRNICITISIINLTGCSLFLPSAEFPIIEKRSGDIHSVTTTADRRVNFIDAKTSYFCAEPAPDVAADLFGQLSAVAKAGLEKDAGVSAGGSPTEKDTESTVAADATNSATDSTGGAEVKDRTKAELELEYAKTVASITKQIFTRTQGVQMFRDGLFNLCQAHHNKALANNEYDKYYEILLENAVFLTSMELYVRQTEELPEAQRKDLAAFAKEIKSIQDSMPKLTAPQSEE